MEEKRANGKKRDYWYFGTISTDSYEAYTRGFCKLVAAARFFRNSVLNRFPYFPAQTNTLLTDTLGDFVFFQGNRKFNYFLFHE